MTDVSSGFSRPVALGVAITDSHIRIVRLELRDTPVVTDAVSLRLSPGDVIDGYVCHQQAVVDLLRRVWDQLKLTWEPVYVALCSPDAQLVTVDLNDPDALELVMDNLGVGRPQAGDSIVGLEIGGVPGFAAMNVARLSSILRIQELADTAGISLAGVDTLPCSLARSQPAACYDPHETALRYNDGRSVWSIRLGGYVATTLSSPPLGDRNPDDKPTFDRIALGTETSITSVVQLADVRVSEKLAARFSVAELAVPVGAALSATENGIAKCDLRSAPTIATPEETTAEPGMTWVVYQPTEVVDSRAKRRRRPA